MMLQKMKTKKKSLAKIFFGANLTAEEMVKNGRLGRFFSPKKVSRVSLCVQLWSGCPRWGC
jgi:hypothetical protein